MSTQSVFSQNFPLVSPSQRYALVSVSDKRGLAEFAQGLTELGYSLISTGGTKTLLASEGIPSLSLDEFTGHPEMMEGRVKTLHPKIHAGILARREHELDLAAMKKEGYPLIDIVVVNLYPFIQAVQGGEKLSLPEMQALIDIGGPTMIRAAAKNFRSVLPVIDPSDYPEILTLLRQGEVPEAVRLTFARKVFTATAAYDLAIASYLGHQETPVSFGPVEGMVLERTQTLRYGENPHQQASLYQVVHEEGRPWKQLGGKELSYNNLLDLSSALDCISVFHQERPTAMLLKHLTPCGGATSETLSEAIIRAKQSDPRSHFGGVCVMNSKLSLEGAEELRKEFLELVIAPSFDEEALAHLLLNKNLRVIEAAVLPPREVREVRSIIGGVLLQSSDAHLETVVPEQLVTSRVPTGEEWRDISFAWKIGKSIKSNAIVLGKHQMVVGIGCGETSRIDAVENALAKAKKHGHEVQGSVCASDAFFPFPDSIETLAKAGVTVIAVPAGAKRDEECRVRAEELGVSLLFMKERHFRH